MTDTLICTQHYTNTQIRKLKGPTQLLHFRDQICRNNTLKLIDFLSKPTSEKSAILYVKILKYTISTSYLFAICIQPISRY